MASIVDTALLHRVGALYTPLLVALVGGVIRRRAPFRLVAFLLSLLWVLPALLALQLLNLRFGWWSFAPGSPWLVRNMPLELLLGWALLWSAVPVMTLPHGVALRMILLLVLDAVLMPRCGAVLTLHRTWLVGEAVAACFVLLPALLIADWTERRSHVRGRAAMQVLTAAMVFLFALPELLFAVRSGAAWEPLLRWRGSTLQFLCEIVFLLALPGISAAQEFAERGDGTPLPFDPPRRLVTSGVYRYCANPMQMFCALTLLLWAVLLRSPLFGLAAGMAVAYSAGLALWDEHTDLRERFGAAWEQYRRAVPAWRLRWRPYHAGAPAVVYVARTCDLCSALGGWIERRQPRGVVLADAESLHDGTLQRMRYDPADGSPCDQGVRAFARVLEHVHLGYALCGFLLRLPGVWWTVQTALDASGLGPRNLVGRPQALHEEPR